jgi:hypothetical protein
LAATPTVDGIPWTLFAEHRRDNAEAGHQTHQKIDPSETGGNMKKTWSRVLAAELAVDIIDYAHPEIGNLPLAKAATVKLLWLMAGWTK